MLAQFPGLKFAISEFTFIDTAAKAQQVALAIASARHGDALPLVFTTLVEPQLQTIIAASDACVVDLFSTFIAPLEDCLGRESAHKQGLPDSLFGGRAYQQRLNAIDYALAHDDGVRPDQFPEADVILVGVSRCGKTPTSLYLAMNFYIKAANYPLLDVELEKDELPQVLQPLRDRLVALTIQPQQLSNIREQRRPGSDYAALAYVSGKCDMPNPCSVCPPAGIRNNGDIHRGNRRLDHEREALAETDRRLKDSGVKRISAMSKRVIPLDKLSIQDVARVGGKNASLGEMIQQPWRPECPGTRWIRYHSGSLSRVPRL